MTVKCVRMDGMYDIWPAMTVSYWPSTSSEERDVVRFERQDGVDGSFDRGTVYVMNDAGKTIDTINLDVPVNDQAIGIASAT